MNDARRKLLKGSLAAPLLLTVQPASANARTSTALVCARRDELRAEQWPRPGELTQADADDWLRIKVDICELYRPNDPRGFERIEGKYFLGADSTHYWRLEESGPGALRASRTDLTVHRVVANKTGEVRNGLVYIDPDGSPTGYAWERNGGRPISQSCWHSFRAQPKPRWWGG